MCEGALGTPKDLELPQSFLMTLHLYSDAGGTVASRVSEVLLLMGTAGDSGIQAGTRGGPSLDLEEQSEGLQHCLRLWALPLSVLELIWAPGAEVAAVVRIPGGCQVAKYGTASNWILSPKPHRLLPSLAPAQLPPSALRAVSLLGTWLLFPPHKGTGDGRWPQPLWGASLMGEESCGVLYNIPPECAGSPSAPHLSQVGPLCTLFTLWGPLYTSHI